jgi:hypothetical protein
MSLPTETLTIPVDAEAARIYRDAPVRRQRMVQGLLSLWLKESDKAGPQSLQALMDEIGADAEARGLTPEILRSILGES